MSTFKLVEENILKFDQSILESEISYNDILTESILTEATEFLNEDEDSKAKKIKDNLVEFFKKMIKWFKDIGKKLASFLRDTVKKLIEKTQDFKNILKNFVNEKTDGIISPSITTSYPSLMKPAGIKKLVQSYGKAAGSTQYIDKEDGVEKVKDDFDEFNRFIDSIRETETPVNRHMAVGLAKFYDMIDGIRNAYVTIQDIAKVALDLVNESIKKCESALRMTKQDDSNKEEIAEARKNVTSRQKSVTLINKGLSKVVSLLTMQQNIYRSSLRSLFPGRNARFVGDKR